MSAGRPSAAARAAVAALRRAGVSESDFVAMLRDVGHSAAGSAGAAPPTGLMIEDVPVDAGRDAAQAEGGGSPGTAGPPPAAPLEVGDLLADAGRDAEQAEGGGAPSAGAGGTAFDAPPAVAPRKAAAKRRPRGRGRNNAKFVDHAMFTMRDVVVGTYDRTTIALIASKAFGCGASEDSDAIMGVATMVPQEDGAVSLRCAILSGNHITPNKALQLAAQADVQARGLRA